jgi:hypothetical protein
MREASLLKDIKPFAIGFSFYDQSVGGLLKMHPTSGNGGQSFQNPIPREPATSHPTH